MNLNVSEHPHLRPTSSASFYPDAEDERQHQLRQRNEDRLYLFGIAICFMALGLNALIR